MEGKQNGKMTIAKVIAPVIAFAIALGLVVSMSYAAEPAKSVDGESKTAASSSIDVSESADSASAGVGVSAVSLAELDTDAKDVESQPFSMDVDCSACHKKAVKKMNKAGTVGSSHAALDCVTCHSDVQALTDVHNNAEKYTAKAGDRVAALSKTQINEDACTGCHGTLDELAEETADSTILTDSNGTTVNPHDLPADHYGTKVNCGSCHKMHDTKDIEETAQNACLTCHHDNVYECGTCHAV